MCNDDMPVSVKVYFGQPTATRVEIRRFLFRTEQHKVRSGGSSGLYQELVERIRSVFNGLNLHNVHLCWKDEDGDYVVFSSDDELRVAISNTKDNTLRIYVREREHPRLTTNAGRPSGVDASGYARISRKGDPNQTQRRHHRRSSRSASASRESDVSSPLNDRRRPIFVKDHIDREYGNGDHSNGASEFTSTNRVDSGDTSTSSGIIEESTSDTMKESSNYQSCIVSAAVCSECRGEGRRGVIYQCTACQDYFLCSECEHLGLHDQHIMLRIRIESGQLATSDGCLK